MPIVEISASDVNAWVPCAVEHMVSVRLRSGALSPTRARAFVASTTARFRVGVPADSRVFTCPDSGDWLWIRTGREPEIEDVRVTRDCSAWADLVFAVSQGQPVAMTAYPGEGSLAGLPHRDISQSMKIAISDLRLPRNYDDIHVRPMSAVELDVFLATTAESSDRHLAAASGPCCCRDSWNVMARAKSRLTDGVATPGHALLSICVDSTTIGGIWAEIDGKHARIWNLYVYSGYRGHGHSRAALLATAEGLKREGVKYMNVTVIAPNKAAIAIYESVGFAVTERHVVLQPPAVGGIDRPALDRTGRMRA